VKLPTQLPTELIEEAFFLRGVIPAKANLRRNGINRKTGKPMTFLPKDVKAVLTGLEFQARAIWAGKPPLTDVVMHVFFHVSNPDSDADNCEKSLYDLLQKAGVLKNDSFRHIRRRDVEREFVFPGKEGVWINISGVPWRAARAKPRKRAA